MSRLTQRDLEGALVRYQVMATIVGTLIILLFGFFFINLATSHCKVEVQVVGVGHGYLYLVYLVTAGLLGFRARLSVVSILCMIGAGLIPGLTFVVEAWITRKVRVQMDADQAAAPPARH
jgi:integral membrane protein